MTDKWVNVTPKHPCLFCNRGDWCRISTDGITAICQRQGGPEAVECRDKNGSPYWIHRLGASDAGRRLPALPPRPQPDRAEVPDLDRVYRALLANLPLDPQHRQHLRARGLDDTAIHRLAYRSLSQAGRPRIVQELLDQYGPDLITKVPGLILKNGSYGHFWTLNAAQGFVVPVRDLDSRIVGLVVRLDEPGTGGKYRWFSSKSAGGPGPLVCCHVPLHGGATHIVRVTEGQLKADVATVLSGTLTLGLPGCTQWKLVLPILERLQPEVILLAWDSDWRHNAHVARGLGECAKALHKQDFHVQMEDWDPHMAKGIDDLLASGYVPTRKGWAACLAAMDRGTAVRPTVRPNRAGVTTCQK